MNHTIVERIRTEHVYPPIPIRTMDWAAWFDGNEGRGTWHGATEQEAIESLMEDESERAS